MPTLEQIQAKLMKLQAQADVMIARKAQAAVDQIRDLMLKHGLTTADIEAKAKARRAARGLNGHAVGGKVKAAAAGKSAPKYRDHKTGATWTGHGRAPAWIAAVKDRTQFLVDGASELKSSAKAVVSRAKGASKGASKGQPKGAQPPKYINSKTGATWSGRGPAPAWLATVKDRTKFLIDGAAATPNVAAKKVTAAKKAVAKKGAAATKKAAAKKSAAKPAAKKATAKKTAAVKKTPGRKPGAQRKAGATSAAAAPQTPTVQTAA